MTNGACVHVWNTHHKIIIFLNFILSKTKVVFFNNELNVCKINFGCPVEPEDEKIISNLFKRFFFYIFSF